MTTLRQHLAHHLFRLALWLDRPGVLDAAEWAIQWEYEEEVLGEIMGRAVRLDEARKARGMTIQ